MCSLLSDYNFWLVVFAAIAAIATIFVAKFTWGLIQVAKEGFNKLLSQEASKKQLEFVGNLVNDIVHAGIVVRGRKVKNWPFHSDVYNIFDFAKTEFVDKEINHAFYLSENVFYKELKQVFSDIRNPLLPPEIADRIYAFSGLCLVSIRTENQLTTPQYILGEEMVANQGELNYVQLESHGGINDWLQICKNVQEAIFKWYTDNGIPNINLLALRLDKY